jgi:hypothetical protein
MLEELRRSLVGLSPMARLGLSFLPLAPVLVTAVLGKAVRGRLRVYSLVLVPLAFGFLCWLCGSAVARDGNLLGALPYALYTLALALYYPLLAIAVAVAWLARRRVPAGAGES